MTGGHEVTVTGAAVNALFVTGGKVGGILWSCEQLSVSQCAGYFIVVLSSPLLETRGGFLQFLCESLVELLEVKTSVMGPLRLGAPGVLTAQGYLLSLP